MNTHERSHGIVIGKVTAVKDPERLGRIEVSFPWMSGPERRWIPVAAPMAGGNRGLYAPPEVDDEVLVAFDHGMWDHPYVIGFTWNPKQPPPSTDERQRIFRSTNDHAVRMVDSTPKNGNRGALIIEDGHGNTVVLTNAHVSINTRGALALNSVGSVTINGRLVRPAGGPI